MVRPEGKEKETKMSEKELEAYFLGIGTGFFIALIIFMLVGTYVH